MPDAMPPDLQGTLDRIARGESFPHRNDGSVFSDREQLLPAKPHGYYREYVHPRRVFAVPVDNGSLSDWLVSCITAQTIITRSFRSTEEIVGGFLAIGISFDCRSLQLDEDSDFIARLPAGICTRAGLFEVLRRELRLPDYFGNNWDALSDCLRDLSWINQRRVAIVHAQLPELGDNELSIYLDILAECVDDWKAADDHQLIVVFPEIAGPVVSAIVEQRG